MTYHPICAFLPLAESVDFSRLGVFSAETVGSYPTKSKLETCRNSIEPSVKKFGKSPG
jgi:hypothetical protein